MSAGEWQALTWWEQRALREGLAKEFAPPGATDPESGEFNPELIPPANDDDLRALGVQFG